MGGICLDSGEEPRVVRQHQQARHIDGTDELKYPTLQSAHVGTAGYRQGR